MSINKKASKWVHAEIISEEQAQRIIEFEKGGGLIRWTNGLYSLGIFAIFMGVSSIIAANWHIIPPNIKLIAHLLINVVLAYGIYIFDRQDRELPRELSVLGLIGLTLTLIALTGQTFHLEGSTTSAILLWMGLCTPFVIVYGKTKISLVPWLIGFVLALGAGVEEYIAPNLGHTALQVLEVGFAIFLPSAFIHFSGSVHNRPVLQQLLYFTGITWAIIVTSIFCQTWYDTRVGIPDAYYEVIGTFVVTALSVFIIKVPNMPHVTKTPENTRLLLLGSLAISVLPFVFPYTDLHFLAQVTFIVYWIFLGFIGQRAGMPRLISASIIIVAIRIFLVYLEVFGSMLKTGFGFIFSGVLLMLMVWLIRLMIRLKGGNND